MRDLPDAVRAKALDAGAPEWLASLPALVAALADEWHLEVGDAFPDPTEAYVVAVTRADGTPAVLKLLVPRRSDAARYEIAVLRLAGGVSCARLLAADEARGALLLERLGPAMSTLALPQLERLPILCDLAAAIWRPASGQRSSASPTAGLPTGAEKAEWLSGYIRRKWDLLGRPCSRAAVDQALAAAESRRAAHDPARAVLNHGDVHQWNALRAGDGFKLVDPDGVWAEPEYDLGVLMREDPVELMAGDPWARAHWLAARTGTDPRAIWEWGVAERVSTGLALTAIGLQPVAADMLAAADAIAGD
ncbi:aminoglycoside phosphotransferase family protein [Paractinoplanes bogorensis]|uniref:aminoglycoside phosphotransferase family protein n=1 Tax=Paractinoplanes bogorensis TaxID=1610840 RepID=UPI0027DF1D9D|nr:aminoglycoside phosphotransferase family protein [Actinoplanes bogorensis]